MPKPNDTASNAKIHRRAVLAGAGAVGLTAGSLALAQPPAGGPGGGGGPGGAPPAGGGPGRGPAAPPTPAQIAAALPLNSPGLEHFGMYVRSVPEAGMFWASLFNKELLHEPFNGGLRHYTVLRWGKSHQIPLTYIAVGDVVSPTAGIRPTQIDHICAYTQAGANNAAISAALAQVGSKGSGQTGPQDPDGLPLQLFAIDGGGIAGGISSSGNVLDGESYFEPIGLKYFIIQASNFEQSLAYYEKAFGVTGRRVPGMQRAWLQIADDRLAIEQAPPGVAPRNYCFGVQVKPFNRAAAVRRLTQMGAKVIPTEGTDDAKALRFETPFGIICDIVEA